MEDIATSGDIKALVTHIESIDFLLHCFFTLVILLILVYSMCYFYNKGAGSYYQHKRRGKK